MSTTATAKVIFNIPLAVKRSAARRAKSEGLTLTALFTQAARAYSAGQLDVQMVTDPPLRPSVLRAINKASEDAKKGKNVSGPFTAEEADRYLRSLMR